VEKGHGGGIQSGCKTCSGGLVGGTGELTWGCLVGVVSKLLDDLLEVCWFSSFPPELFQRHLSVLLCGICCQIQKFKYSANFISVGAGCQMDRAIFPSH
jgi:hypothetical protein